MAIEPGEGAKRWETVQAICEWMASNGFDRNSALLSLGGGVVGDITGFVASIYMRSIPCAHIPTTVLAQADSCLGGKTAIDLGPRKNLLGTFHQPDRIYVDPGLLGTLPPEEIRNGLAEVIKSAVIRDENLFRYLENHRESALKGEGEVMDELILRCCRIKAEVVTRDERDSGLRQILNFGHTVGHAIEAQTGYRIPHGSAVSIGMAAETFLSLRMDLLHFRDAERILRLLRDCGLPVRIPENCAPDLLISRMRSDKKAEDGKIAMVLPEAVGKASLVKQIPMRLIETVLREARS